VVTGAAVGDILAETNHDYDVYFGASDDKLYSVRVTYNGSYPYYTTSLNWTYSLNGTATGTPVLGMSDGTKAVFVSDDSSRLHCVDASSGSQIWRSAQFTDVTITPPLYIYGGTPGTYDDSSRVYVGSTGSFLYAFDTWANSSSVSAKWSRATDGSVVMTPSEIIRDVPGGEEEDPVPTGPHIIITTTSAHVHEIYDQDDGGGASHANLRWTYYDPDPPTTQTCESWATIGSDYRIFFASYGTNSKSRIYGLDILGDQLWDPITQAYDGVTLKDIGKIVANGCNDHASTTTAFFLTKNAGSGTSKPSVIRMADLTPSQGLAYFARKMASTSDELTPTPIYTNANNTNYLNFVTATGYLWVINPLQTILYVNPFPTHPTSSIPRIDLAMDREGVIIFVTSAGVLRADWGP